MDTATALIPRTPGSIEPLNLGPQTPWRTVLAEYLRRIDSKNTRQAYEKAISRCFEWIGKDSVGRVGPRDLNCYREHLVNRRKPDGTAYAPKSIALELTAVRSFFFWAQRPHVGVAIMAREAIEDTLSIPRGRVIRPFSILTDPELGQALESAKSARDRALIAILAGAGLRISEAINLDVADIREQADGSAQIHVRHGKGGKDRIVPIRADVLAFIHDSMTASKRTAGDETPLFRAFDPLAPTRERKRLSVRSAQEIVHETMKRAGIKAKTISAHSLRHTFAMRALRAGVGLVSLAKLLGHSAVTTTQIYVDHMQLDELGAKIPALPI